MAIPRRTPAPAPEPVRSHTGEQMNRLCSDVKSFSFSVGHWPSFVVWGNRCQCAHAPYTSPHLLQHDLRATTINEGRLEAPPSVARPVPPLQSRAVRACACGKCSALHDALTPACCPLPLKPRTAASPFFRTNTDTSPVRSPARKLLACAATRARRQWLHATPSLPPGEASPATASYLHN